MAGYVDMKTGEVSIVNNISIIQEKIYSNLIRPTLYKHKYENFAYDIELKKGLIRISKNLELECKLLDDDNVHILLHYIKINKGYLYNSSDKTLLYSFFVKKDEQNEEEHQQDTVSEVFCEEPVLTFTEELKSKLQEGKYPIEKVEIVEKKEEIQSEFQKELHEAVIKRMSRVKSRDLKKKNKRLKKKS
jgi:hypothetical protein